MSHHEFSPSKFPNFEKCFRYESSDEVGQSAIRGTAQHKVLENMILGREERHDLTNTEMDQVEYAFGKIKSLMAIHIADDSTLKAERKVIATSTNMVMIDGTADVTFVGTFGELVVCDYKSGMIRDYSGQMKVYCLAVAQEVGITSGPIVGYCIYGKSKEAVRYDFLIEDLQVYFDGMVEKLLDRENQPHNICEYCSWCAKSTRCPARNSVAKKGMAIAEDPTVGITIRTNLETLSGEKLGKLFEFSKLLASWCESVEKEVKKRLDHSKPVDGWEYKVGVSNIAEPKAILAKLKEHELVDKFMESLNFTQKSLKEVNGVDFFNETFKPLYFQVSGSKTLTKIKEDSKDVADD